MDILNCDRRNCVPSPPQTPAVNSAQWAPQASSPSSGTQYNGFKEYNPYQQSSAHMAPLQMTPLQPLNQPQYGNYEAAASMPMAMPYPQVLYLISFLFSSVSPTVNDFFLQMQSSFHSVQLVPCLCPISKDVIEQQTQQMQHSAPAPSPVESGNNAVTQGSRKVNS